MPVQQQMSSFSKKLGARVAAANAEHRDKPVDTGNRRLPAGIRNGIAKLSAMYTKEQAEDGAKTPKGETFFRASASVMSPESYNGERVMGLVTQVIIPLCDVPEKGQRKAVSFEANWFEFQNLFKLLGVSPPNETPQTDPTGQRTEAYYVAAMKALVDPQRPPVYISFSTRGWTPPPSPTQPKPEEMVFEAWHGLAYYKPTVNPAAGVVEGNPTHTQPEPFTEPPQGQVEYPAQTQTATQRGAAPPPTDGPPPQYQPGGEPDLAEVVAALIETAMNDPEGATEEGASASARLEELAWDAGWTKEQTAGAADWAAVGEMALTEPPGEEPVDKLPIPFATVGSRHKFAKRTKDGAKLKNSKGEEFPPQEVEVTSVDPVNNTCTVKTVKDGKPVIDIRTKQPVAVKFEWLE